MKIRHYTIIDKHTSPVINWDFVRDNPQEPAYFIPFTKDEYVESVKKHAEESHYKEILNYCEKNNIQTIISLGSGRCILEYALKTNSKLKVIVSDTSSSINRIKNFGIFDDALQADYLRDPNMYEVDENTMILLSRIDTEFDDDDFGKLFEKFARHNVEHIIFIPAELLDGKIFLAETKIFIKSILTGKKRIFCGYARTKSTFYKIWGSYYKVTLENIQKQLFFLKKQL